MNRGSFAAVVALLAGGTNPPAAPLVVEAGAFSARLAEVKPGTLASETAWQPGAGGFDWALLRLHGKGEVRRTAVVAARLDPARFSFSLQNGMAPGGMHVWTLGLAPADAALAVNAGMFAGDGAWGWVVHAGKEYRAPGMGPLAAAIIIDSAGRVELTDDAGLQRVRSEEMGRVREAFQSYPMLLAGDSLPELLQSSTGLIDLNHRDARLALGLDRNGQVVVALTRFDALGPSMGSVPFGLTLSEMALVMRGLGAVSAVSLDGGISAQLLLRDGSGEAHRWAGLRAVPLGLSATPRRAVSGEW